MLLFSLDVKFQVYEKICTKLLLINFNNVYGCILLVWTWVLYKKWIFLLTWHDRQDFNCTWALKFSTTNFWKCFSCRFFAVKWRRCSSSTVQDRCTSPCSPAPQSDIGVFSFPHSTRSARAGAGAERGCCALWGLCSAGRVLPVRRACAEGKEHLLSPTCWMAAQPRGLEDTPHFPGVAADWFMKWGEGWADQAFPLLEPVRSPAQP